MIFKKLNLSLVAIFFGSVCVNAEQRILDENLNLAQGKDVQTLQGKHVIKPQYYDLSHVANCLKNVCDCKIHHDVTDLGNLGMIDVLCVLLNCDKAWLQCEKDMDCGCRITLEKCGCIAVELCVNHLLRLEDVASERLALANELAVANEVEENEEVTGAVVENLEVEVNDAKKDVQPSNHLDNLNQELKTYWVGDVLFIDLSNLDLNNLEPSDLLVKSQVALFDVGIARKCDSDVIDLDGLKLGSVEPVAESGGMSFDSGIIGVADVNLDEDMSNLDPYGVYTRD